MILINYTHNVRVHLRKLYYRKVHWFSPIMHAGNSREIEPSFEIIVRVHE